MSGEKISVVIARACGRSSIPETSMMEPWSRGVLDAPHARGMTPVVERSAVLRRCPRLMRDRRIGQRPCDRLSERNDYVNRLPAPALCLCAFCFS